MSCFIREVRDGTRAIARWQVLCRAPSALRGVALAVVMLFAAAPAAADSRTDFLVQMLSTSSQFRVRAQAALALAGRTADGTVMKALSQGLRDEHPAVRAASASALEQLHDGRAITWLETASRDSDASVRAAASHALRALKAGAIESARVASNSASSPPLTDGASFYLALGMPTGKSAGLSDGLARDLRGHLASQVLQIAGVRIAPDEESLSDAQRVLAQKRLTGYHLESAVTALDVRPDGSIRAQVSVVVATYPGRDIRAMLTGAATIVGGGHGDADKLEVISAAFSGALRRLPQALQAGLARAP